MHSPIATALNAGSEKLLEELVPTQLERWSAVHFTHRDARSRAHADCAGDADANVHSHFGGTSGGRYVSLLGDAELDEGSIWETLGEPLVRTLGNVLWIVDLNRQSLDRVVPGIRALEQERQFETLGWQVIELKYGRRLRAAFRRRGGDVLRRRIDEMPNEQYQGLFGASEEVIRATLALLCASSSSSSACGLRSCA